MAALNRRTPPGRAGSDGDLQGRLDNDLHPHSSLSVAAVKTTLRELGIVVSAANRMASGYGLAWSDYDRLHQAHQHLVKVLAEAHGVEVTV